MNYFNVKKSKKTALALLFSVFFCVSAFAQQVSVKGTVTDPQGEPIIGAYVTLKGANGVGTVTDYDGNFNLKVPANGTLVFSYAGYKRQEVSVAGKSVVSVKLAEEAIGLDEVVAVGYGSQTKKELTGSVASIKAEDFNKGSFNSATGLLQGKVAGLTISKNDGGDPNSSSYSILMRGTGSLTGTSEPLYIIDGVPGGSLNSVNPNDIESMDVLKDGSAAAIYGTRANAGVILITTKKGAAGKTQVEYSGSLRLDQVAGKIKTLSAQEFIDAGGANLGLGASTDWFDEITRALPISHEHNLALSGGSDKLTYRTSVNYKDNEGLAINSEYKELMGRCDVTQKALNNMLELNYDMSYTSSTNAWVSHDAYQQSILFNPTAPVYADPTSTYYVIDGGYFQNRDKNGQYNPVGIIKQTTDDGKSQTFLGSVRATLSPFKGFKIGTFGSYQYYNQSTGKYIDNDSFWGSGASYEGIAKKSNNFNVTRLIETTAQYTGQLKKHSYSLLAGHSYQDYTEESGSFTQTYLDNYYLYNNMGAGEGITKLASGDVSNAGIGMSSNKAENKLASLFARIMYNYSSRYFFNASVRYEGSSKFGANNRWGCFPAVSGSWLITEEDFMKGQTLLSNLKLRTGYGITGNVPSDNYAWIGLMQPNEDKFYDGESQTWVTTYSLSTNPNPNLKWEKKGELNIGLDFGFLKGRMNGTLDYYNRRTSDLLYNYSVDSKKYTKSTMLMNYGTIGNQGIELSLNYLAVKTKDFTWNVGLTAAHNENKLISFGDGVNALISASDKKRAYTPADGGWTSTYTQYMEVGKAIGNFYGFKFSHIDESGVFYGYAKNGTIKEMSKLTDKDKQVLGNALPLLNWGLTSSMNYRNIDLSFNIRGAIGGHLLNYKRLVYGSNSALAYGNIMKCKDNGLNTPKVMTDYYLEDATYGKLGDVTIGYTFNISPEVQKYLSRARVYVTGQNLLTISDYSGVDPEAVSMAGLTPGIEYLTYYPTTRSFILGVNLSF